MKCRTCCNPVEDLWCSVTYFHMFTTLILYHTLLIGDELPLSAALYGVYILSSGTPGNCSILFSVGPEYAAGTSSLHLPSL